jgi:prophage tail gpP-like protein
MAAPDSTLTIVVAGRRFGGWLDVQVSRGVEAAAASFDISCTQRWPGADERFELEEGQSCEVWIGADKVLTGYIDVVDIERQADSASCKIAGRSKTCDLVDCSPDFEVVEFAGQDIAAIARKLAQPFGVEVVAQSSAPALPLSAAQKGETVWKLVERLARQRQLLVMDDPEGRLVLARLAAELADDSLVYPSDGLKRISTKRDSSKRFSVYRVKAQAGTATRWADAGSDDTVSAAEAAAHVTGEFFDRGVKRYRPKTILAEGAAKKEGADKRAEWECRRNIGKALRIAAQRVDWRQSSGKLWVPNLLVPVKIDAAKVDARLAIATVSYRKSGEGTLCDLELVPPEALTPEPPEAAAAAGGGGTVRWDDVLKGHDG